SRKEAEGSTWAACSWRVSMMMRIDDLLPAPRRVRPVSPSSVPHQAFQVCDDADCEYTCSRPSPRVPDAARQSSPGLWDPHWRSRIDPGRPGRSCVDPTGDGRAGSHPAGDH
ncbi:hypothetical protein ACX3T8_03135, partial [Corynebacterium pyruviciproducens]